MVIFGFMDYEDQFGSVHRSGYGRVYAPIRDVRPANINSEDFYNRNNLVYFDTPSTYNFDLPRDTKGAWIEPSLKP